MNSIEIVLHQKLKIIFLKRAGNNKIVIKKIVLIFVKIIEIVLLQSSENNIFKK